MDAHGNVAGPDFSQGVRCAEVPERGLLSGRVGDTAVLLSRAGDELFAVSGNCTHYGALLGAGSSHGETVRCPLHHACFSLRTGEALRAPALDPLDRWRVDIEGDTVFVRARLDALAPTIRSSSSDVRRIVIVGGGGAGLACAHELRRLGFAGNVTILSSECDAPCDRPNLSKDYLAGTAPEEWLPLRSGDWYDDNHIDLRVSVEVQRIDAANHRVNTTSGDLSFDRLLVATGSEPNRLSGTGFDAENIFTLRSIRDASAIAALAKPGARAAIIGSSFIGLEAAAALRQRKVEVTVISPEHVPFECVFGAEIGTWLQRLHERNGVNFHLGTVAACFQAGALQLANGAMVNIDFALVGVGVRPRVSLADAAGIPSEGGVPVNEFLETPLAGIYAAGDVAAYPDPLSGERVRIEHWVTAQRQGQIAAANMLGEGRRYDAVPFFWTEQYGVALRYVGHAARWDHVEVDGQPGSGDFIARYYEQGAHRASAAVGRDATILEDERIFEEMIAKSRSRTRGSSSAVLDRVTMN